MIPGEMSERVEDGEIMKNIPNILWKTLYRKKLWRAEEWKSELKF